VGYYWDFQILPGLTAQKGFETGFDMSINPSFSEKNADFLNDSND